MNLFVITTVQKSYSLLVVPSKYLDKYDRLDIGDSYSELKEVSNSLY